jgi:hypothetical protein
MIQSAAISPVNCDLRKMCQGSAQRENGRISTIVRSLVPQYREVELNPSRGHEGPEVRERRLKMSPQKQQKQVTKPEAAATRTASRLTPIHQAVIG